MTIKHVIALLLIILGIWANLELQQAIAESRGAHSKLLELHAPIPTLSSGQCDQFGNSRSIAEAPRKGERRREWPALAEGCDATLAHQQLSSWASPHATLTALHSLD